MCLCPCVGMRECVVFGMSVNICVFVCVCVCVCVCVSSVCMLVSACPSGLLNSQGNKAFPVGAVHYWVSPSLSLKLSLRT